MKLEYIGLSEIDGLPDLCWTASAASAYDEMAEISLENGEKRYGPGDHAGRQPCGAPGV